MGNSLAQNQNRICTPVAFTSQFFGIVANMDSGNSLMEAWKCNFGDDFGEDFRDDF